MEQLLLALPDLFVHLLAGLGVGGEGTVGKEGLVQGMAPAVRHIRFAVSGKDLLHFQAPGVGVGIDDAADLGTINRVARAVGAGENAIEEQVGEELQIFTIVFEIGLDGVEGVDALLEGVPLGQLLTHHFLQLGIVEEVVPADLMHRLFTQLAVAVVFQQDLLLTHARLMDLLQLLLKLGTQLVQFAGQEVAVAVLEVAQLIVGDGDGSGLQHHIAALVVFHDDTGGFALLIEIAQFRGAGDQGGLGGIGSGSGQEGAPVLETGAVLTAAGVGVEVDAGAGGLIVGVVIRAFE